MQSSPITCHADDGFLAWFAQARGSIVISTYQAGKLLLLGWHRQQISILMRQFDKPMGIAVQNNRLALATRHEIFIFANAHPLAYSFLEDQPGRYDALYLPRVSYLTGDLFVHDLSFGTEDLWFVNTRFSCLATPSSEYSFVPRWQPPFISELTPEDRCHLNGMAIVNGKPKYVTALGISNTAGGWRASKATGGVVMDVDSNEIILQGLSMPHSPVWHNDYLWLLNSGTGELWRFDPRSDRHEVICSLPGYGRGLCIVTCALTDERAEVIDETKKVRTYALVGLSQIREQHIFGGLPIQKRMENLLCGVAVVDLDNGRPVGFLTFEQGCQELYGIVFHKGIYSPSILNHEKPEIRDAFTTPEFAYWVRSSSPTQEKS